MAVEQAKLHVRQKLEDQFHQRESALFVRSDQEKQELLQRIKELEDLNADA